MSLAIDTNSVTHVLLADGWHEVADQTFDLDAYEYIEYRRGYDKDPSILVGGGDVPGVSHTGAEWSEPDGSRVRCPLTAVLAVKVG